MKRALLFITLFFILATSASALYQCGDGQCSSGVNCPAGFDCCTKLTKCQDGTDVYFDMIKVCSADCSGGSTYLDASDSTIVSTEQSASIEQIDVYVDPFNKDDGLDSRDKRNPSSVLLDGCQGFVEVWCKVSGAQQPTATIGTTSCTYVQQSGSWYGFKCGSLDGSTSGIGYTATCEIGASSRTQSFTLKTTPDTCQNSCTDEWLPASSFESGTSPRCCGDDSREHYNYKKFDSTGNNIFDVIDTTMASCCNGARDCVWGAGSCYGEYTLGGTNSETICSGGGWYQCNENSACNQKGSYYCDFGEDAQDTDNGKVIGQWSTTPPAETGATECANGVNDDCDTEWDYDTMDRGNPGNVPSHGDDGCPVEVTKCASSPSNPDVGETFQVACTASPDNVNSITATPSTGGSCSFDHWIGSDASFTCTFSSSGSKTVTCGVDGGKSYQSGSDKTCTINVQPVSCSGSPASRSCGDCGTQTQICVDGSWTYDGASCVGDTSMNETRSCTDGNGCAGEQTRWCQGDGTWGSWGSCVSTQNWCDQDCDGTPETCVPGSCNACSSCADNDNDGYNDSSCGGTDCDDTNATIHPGATENCTNTLDDNCNGQIDCADADCASDPACQSSFCGDGVVQTPNDNGVYEQCDDGNTLSGDGCNSTCQWESCLSAFSGPSGLACENLRTDGYDLSWKPPEQTHPWSPLFFQALYSDENKSLVLLGCPPPGVCNVKNDSMAWDQGSYVVDGVLQPGTLYYNRVAAVCQDLNGTQEWRDVMVNCTTLSTHGWANVSGHVFQEDGAPLPGATVAVVSPPPGFLNTTDEHGSYALHDIPVGERFVSAAKSGYRSQTVNVMLAPGENRLDFTLSDGDCQACADWENRCSVACGGVDQCGVETVPAVCEGARPGDWVFDSVQNEYVRCCEGEETREKLGAPTLSGCMEHLVKYTRIVYYMGQPVSLEVYAWRPCER